MSGERWIYTFDDGGAHLARLLGGKGAYLAEMARLGLPVPPGFTITTAACGAYLAAGGRLPPGLEEALAAAVAWLEARTGKRFGDPAAPLLVAVRSGAPVSMPGMMDTILNLGLNDAAAADLAAATGDPRFALDCYRRFLQMFGDVVLKVPHDRFEALLGEARRAQGAAADPDLTAETLRELVAAYQRLIADVTGRAFPFDPREQLRLAVRAVFDSWHNPRARVYRQANAIPDDLYTGVTVQAMVFGNMGEDSGSGVLFTRDPSTGERVLYGEYLPNAQGEDVVAGLRTPLPVARLAERLPAVHAELARAAGALEGRFRDMQDMEFTVERGRLFILQCRAGKRAPRAAVKVAHDMAAEGLISREEALLRVEPAALVHLMHAAVDPAADLTPLAAGLPASPGAATGEAVFDAGRAEDLSRGGRRVILVRPETSPDDIHGIIGAQGVLTSRGGMTCHAAIVARGMGKPCVVGCEALRIDLDGRRFNVDGTTVAEGQVISIDGTTGRVFAGEVPVAPPRLPPELDELLRWADAARRLRVEANADTPDDARRALEMGAEGIGLCRTEHMFMGPDRLPVMRALILAEDAEARRAALERLLPLQEGDFEAILRVMAGRPVTIRLLDPPLHEFLPDREALLAELAKLRRAGNDARGLAEKEALLRRVEQLAEANPMLGHRGCRLGITFPEVYETQARAVFRAAARLAREGVPARPRVMIPLVGHAAELARLRVLVDRVAAEVFQQAGIAVPYQVGTMIEVPRAALTAGEIAREAAFFSFGTNDLTQTTFGFSRDDAEAKFLPAYLEEGILPANPFAALDEAGVGRLILMAVQAGRATRPGLEVGICGEHGGDPASIVFCHRAGLDHVSCSPFRVPIARLAAAQAALAPDRPA